MPEPLAGLIYLLNKINTLNFYQEIKKLIDYRMEINIEFIFHYYHIELN